MQRHLNAILAVLAVLATAGALWWTSRAVAPRTSTWADVVEEAERGGYRIVTTEELAAEYRRDPAAMLLVDTRQAWEFRSGHVRGAVNFPVEPTGWSRWRKAGDLERLLGPDRNRKVVFYWAGLAWVRSDSAARVAVQLGYRNVFRDPKGFPDWQQAGLPTASQPSDPVGPAARPDSLGPLHGWGMLWTLLGVFAGGLALNLTPCVYPMIPITASYFGGRSTGSAPARGRLAAHGFCYILGLALTHSILGVAAALTGGLLGSLLQHPAVSIGVSAVLLLFAASLFGLWELRLPGFLTQAAAKSHGGYFGSLFMGLTLGVVAAPCIGPFVLGLLTWVAGTGSPWLGFVVFFTLSLGLGLPLFLLAVFSGQLERLPRSGGWMLWVRSLMGWVLAAMAVYFLKPVLREPWSTVVLVAVALAAGGHLGWSGRDQDVSRVFAWLKAAAGAAALALATFLVAGLVLKGPGVAWTPYSEAAFAEARRLGRPIVLDFYAAWCAPCRELDEVTFHDGAVVRAAAERFLMVKVDVTRGGDPGHERLLRDFNVKGVPTVVFLDAGGRERSDLRLVDFISPELFLERMNRLAQGGG